MHQHYTNRSSLTTIHHNRVRIVAYFALQDFGSAEFIASNQQIIIEVADDDIATKPRMEMRQE